MSLAYAETSTRSGSGLRGRVYRGVLIVMFAFLTMGNKNCDGDVDPGGTPGPTIPGGGRTPGAHCEVDPTQCGGGYDPNCKIQGKC
jgi:hypothetical protein